MLEANKALVRRLVEDVFNGRRLETADEVLASDFVNHNSLAAGLRGLEGTEQWGLVDTAGLLRQLGAPGR